MVAAGVELAALAGARLSLCSSVLLDADGRGKRLPDKNNKTPSTISVHRMPCPQMTSSLANWQSWLFAFGEHGCDPPRLTKN